MTCDGRQWPAYDSFDNDVAMWPSYLDFCSCRLSSRGFDHGTEERSYIDLRKRTGTVPLHNHDVAGYLMSFDFTFDEQLAVLTEDVECSRVDEVDAWYDSLENRKTCWGDYGERSANGVDEKLMTSASSLCLPDVLFECDGKNSACRGGRGRQLFSELHDEVNTCLVWRGSWEPLGRVLASMPKPGWMIKEPLSGREPECTDSDNTLATCLGSFTDIAPGMVDSEDQWRNPARAAFEHNKSPQVVNSHLGKVYFRTFAEMAWKTVGLKKLHHPLGKRVIFDPGGDMELLADSRLKRDTQHVIAKTPLQAYVVIHGA